MAPDVALGFNWPGDEFSDEELLPPQDETIIPAKEAKIRKTPLETAGPFFTNISLFSYQKVQKINFSISIIVTIPNN